MDHTAGGASTRRFTRHQIDVRLKVSFRDDGKPMSVFGRANVLGQGGLGAFIPYNMPIGTQVTLEISFPYSPAELTIEAIVRNSLGFRYGLEFMKMGEEARSVIIKNCNSATALE
ncbi:MAG TPA: PilZ domain-containing protein [Candidatus Angelobacter sp.]|jgi:hypothetical protein|nr:PilZ domain-containing protein [Candidatus Angelobacter sp.]